MKLPLYISKQIERIKQEGFVGTLIGIAVLAFMLFLLLSPFIAVIILYYLFDFRD